MTDHFTEDDVLAAIPRLTRVQLFTYLEARIVAPFHSETGLVYRRVDIARMELLCDLTEDLELGADSLSVVMSLIDQLHMARRDLRAIINAIAVQPPEVKARIAATVNGA